MLALYKYLISDMLAAGRFFRTGGLSAIAALFICFLVGCAQGPSDVQVSELENEGSALFAEQTEATATPDGGGWTVGLRAIDADRGSPEAWARTVASETGLSGITVMERGGRRFLTYGRFPSPTSPKAQAALRRVRNLELRGNRPFRGASMLPLDTTQESERGGSSDRGRHDIIRAAERNPDAFYTLQVGIYGREDGGEPTSSERAEFHAAAEQAVRQLRAEGAEAYYWHAPNRSHVMVGLFGEEDLDASVQPPIESAALQEARENHPHNLLNGTGIRERIRGAGGRTDTRLQPSFLVEIPGR
mgnify:CR=1 FL=1